MVTKMCFGVVFSKRSIRMLFASVFDCDKWVTQWEITSVFYSVFHIQALQTDYISTCGNIAVSLVFMYSAVFLITSL